MAGMKKTDIETLKAFISRQDDVYRRALGEGRCRMQAVYLCRNHHSERGFLRDTTGNRRFWPVMVGKGKREAWSITQDEVNQIWAEAMVLYKDKEKLCLSDEVEAYAEEMQREAMETDEREGIIEAYLEKLLPRDWDSWDMYKRKEYMRDYDEKDSVMVKGTEKRKTVCVLEIWCEALGGTPGNH
jgi:predicted P-loop ATPase